jgi:hypothetical protein
LLIALGLPLLAACGRNPVPTAPGAPAEETVLAGSCTLDLPADANDEAAIQAVLEAESRFMVAQQIDPLMRLWADGSHVADAKNTSDDGDNQNWEGKDAIRHRYVRTVFPGAASSANPADLEITLDGDRASVRATTQIGDEISPAGDRWELVKINGCWSIQSLTYNLEPKP